MAKGLKKTIQEDLRLTLFMPDGTKLAEFVAWCQKNITGDEKGQAQIFLDRLFQAFGQPGSLDVGGHRPRRAAELSRRKKVGDGGLYQAGFREGCKMTTQHSKTEGDGQRNTLGNLDKLVDEFDLVLRQHGILITPGSELEAACLSITDLSASHQNPLLRDRCRDTRQLYINALGIWTFLAKIVRLHNKPGFAQFLPHLHLLNKGIVVQNKPLQACEDATNKIFELLFALVLLDIGNDVVLDHPFKSKGDNPDILVTLKGRRWGFACKTVYGKSGKTFFDNLKRGVEQIDNSKSAEVGCVVINFRNLIQHEQIWPVEYRPYGTLQFKKPDRDRIGIGLDLNKQVTSKQDSLADEIGVQEVLAIFSKGKAIPGFLAYCQSAAGLTNSAGIVIPSSILMLILAEFRDSQRYKPVFSEMNEALHERRKS